jgi:MarR family transcriptional regulator, transcriptional regulator for hemolysin
MGKPFKSEFSVGYLIHEAAKVLRRRFEEEAKRHDLTLPQWRVLAELAQGEGMSQVALAGTIDADPMTLSGILDRLEKRGLLTRGPDPADSRAKIAQLTGEGHQLFDAARAVGSEIYATAVEGFSPAELDALAQGLIRIRNNLNNAAAPRKEAV